MANLSDLVQRRSSGFSGPEGELFDELNYQNRLSSLVNPQRMITNESISRQPMPQNYIQRTGGEAIDLGPSGRQVMIQGRPAILDPNNENLTVYGASGKQYHTSMSEQRGVEAERQRRAEAADLPRRMALAKVQEQEMKAKGGTGKLQFSETQGGFVEPPSAQFPQGRIIPIPGIKKKQQNMSPTVQKELFDTEEQIQGGEQALSFIKQAQNLNKEAMGFAGAGALAYMGTILPDALRPEAVDATQELTNIVQNTALPQLKAIFGGMPTEGERKILLEMQGSVSQPAKVRESIFNRAEKAARSRLEFNKLKAMRLREGSYFSGDGITQPSTDDPSNYGNDDAEAVAWAQANPDDPRAIQIMSLHGG